MTATEQLGREMQEKVAEVAGRLDYYALDAKHLLAQLWWTFSELDCLKREIFDGAAMAVNDPIIKENPQLLARCVYMAWQAELIAIFILAVKDSKVTVNAPATNLVLTCGRYSFSPLLPRTVDSETKRAFKTIHNTQIPMPIRAAVNRSENSSWVFLHKACRKSCHTPYYRCYSFTRSNIVAIPKVQHSFQCFSGAPPPVQLPDVHVGGFSDILGASNFTLH